MKRLRVFQEEFNVLLQFELFLDLNQEIAVPSGPVQLSLFMMELRILESVSGVIPR